MWSGRQESAAGSPCRLRLDVGVTARGSGRLPAGRSQSPRHGNDWKPVGPPVSAGSPVSAAPAGRQVRVRPHADRPSEVDRRRYGLSELVEPGVPSRIELPATTVTKD